MTNLVYKTQTWKQNKIEKTTYDLLLYIYAHISTTAWRY